MTRFQELFGKYKYVLIVLAAGLLLLILPKTDSGSGDSSVLARDGPGLHSAYSQTPDEAKLSALLSQIDGAGEVRIALSENGAVVISQSSAASVRLELTNAITAYTNLTSNKIIILKGEVTQ
ncbi:MAG: hypothetical protein LBN97_01660 [Oscillospiraceae bacterium]|jgi:stage III sporulation protein AG|nr:hypothetical protein [Oscillospiraceae bacterium]